MRRPADASRVRAFMAELGRRSREEATVYLAGGATAVLFGWRDTTIDVDMRVEPDSDAILRLLPSIKEALEINVELASPADFIPELPGWRDRGLFVARHGPLTFYHFDPYSQLLSKVERSHHQDRVDVDAWLRSGLVDRVTAQELFAAIEPQLYRFPAIDPGSFRRSVEAQLGGTAD